MNYKVLYNPALLINEMILFGDTLLNMSVNVKLFLCRGCDGCCVFCLYCEAWSCRCSYMGSVSVSSSRCCMFVSCIHPVAVLNAAF